MLYINEDYECERYKYGWKLYRWRDGKDKHGNPKRSYRTTYHGTLRQVCQAVLDSTMGNAGSIEEMRSILEEADNMIQALSGAEKE